MSLSLGGLISGVMGGAARGYTKVAEGELEKQQSLDLKKELAEIEFEKDQRIKEADSMRARSEETRKLSPEYLETVGRADLTKGQIAAGNRKTLAPVNAEAEGAELEANAGNITRKAELTGQAEATGLTAKVNAPGYAAAKRQETDLSESNSARASASAAANRDKREQADFDRLQKARKISAEYQDALDRGDEAAAKDARKRGLELGLDPAALKRGELKVTEDESGNKVLVHEDGNGNVTRVDTNVLDAYRPRTSTTKPNRPPLSNFQK